MTREEAVEVLKERYLTCVGIGLDNHANRVNEALDLAIEALSEKHQLSEETPTMKVDTPTMKVDTPTEPTCKKCTDLISRADAKRTFQEICSNVTCIECSMFNGDGEVCRLAEWLNALPSADRPKGEWIDWLGKGNEWECSVCKCSVESHGNIAYNFCPNCGADMRGEEE